MRRLLLASLAFLLLFLPFQVGSAQAPAESCCAGCAGMPACPPKCPAPPSVPIPLSPSVAKTATASDWMAAEQIQRHEPSPAPSSVRAAMTEPEALKGSFDAPLATGPPDRTDRQAALRIFRI